MSLLLAKLLTACHLVTNSYDGTMLTLTRKERERQEREARILDVARQMLRDSGYLGLNMDRIAAQMEYSKGTIYQHFPNKEEILLALANEALQQRVEMFQRASTWQGRPRERMAAIGAAAAEFVRLYPLHFSVSKILSTASIWEKTSELRRLQFRDCETCCKAIMGEIIQQAVNFGDLHFPPGTSAETLVFGLWSINFGAYSIMTSDHDLTQIGFPDPEMALWQNQSLLLDGYGWRPLTHELDFVAIFEQAKQELFGGQEPPKNQS